MTTGGGGSFFNLISFRRESSSFLYFRLKIRVCKTTSFINFSPQLVPRLRWPLMIYDLPMSLILKLEKKVSFHISKWLGLHRSIFNVCCIQFHHHAFFPCKDSHPCLSQQRLVPNVKRPFCV